MFKPIPAAQFESDLWSSQGPHGAHGGQAVCVLKGEKADWETARRLLGDASFMKMLLEFDKDNIPDSVIRRLRRYLDDPAFTPEAVAKQSRAVRPYFVRPTSGFPGAF